MITTLWNPQTSAEAILSMLPLRSGTVLFQGHRAFILSDGRTLWDPDLSSGFPSSLHWVRYLQQLSYHFPVPQPRPFRGESRPNCSVQLVTNKNHVF